MARKEKRSEEAARLEVEMAAGDWRSARATALGLVASGADADRDAAARVLERLRPGPTALFSFLAGLAFIAAVAVLGLLRR